MPRFILDESNIHPAVREKIAGSQRAIVQEVQAAVREHAVVVVGMGMNPIVKKAKAVLDGEGVKYAYLEYGNYFNTWRQRNALKMWTGWPTFPMVFVKGVLLGGAEDLQAVVSKGELKALLA